MKNKKTKKWIIVTICIAVAAGVLVGIRAIQQGKKRADVESVANLNQGYWDGGTNTSGTITADSAMSIYLNNGLKVAKLYVHEGDTVKAGDLLMEYDVSSIDQAIDYQQQDLSLMRQALSISEQRLTILEHTQPVPDPSPQPEPDPKPEPEPEKPEQVEDSYTFIDDSVYDKAIKTTYLADQSEENALEPVEDLKLVKDKPVREQYTYYVTKEGYVTGSVLKKLQAREVELRKQWDNYVEEWKKTHPQPETPAEPDPSKEDPTQPTDPKEDPNPQEPVKEPKEPDWFLQVSFIVTSDNKKVENKETKPSTLISQWELFPQYIPDDLKDDTKLYVMTGVTTEKKPDEDPVVDPADDPETDDTKKTYTWFELEKEIIDQRQKIRELRTSISSAENQLNDLASQSADGAVRAKFDGTVITAGDPANPPIDGSVFLYVLGSNGLYIRGDISELLLNQVDVGTPVTATSYETGKQYEAEIMSIDRYPDASNDNYYGGNPNVSYYGFSAKIKDADDLSAGSWLDLSIGSGTSSIDSNTIWLSRMYVRDEANKHYVLKDQDGKLVKQYVKTGRIVYGELVEIQNGLSLDDYIAFPYGKTAKEGMKTRRSDAMDDNDDGQVIY